MQSGKTKHALHLAEHYHVSLNLPCLYLATAEAIDGEMQRKITAHQAERPAHIWRTIEEPINIADIINEHQDYIILCDCLSLWVNNILYYQPHADDDYAILDDYIASIIQAISGHTNPLLFVSNEISFSPVPIDALTRQYQRYIGRVHQQIASHATYVQLMVAGIPMMVK